MPYMPRPNTIDPKLAAALRALREQAGLSQEDLAQEADLTTGAVSRIERAKMNPSWTTLQSILVALKADLADLQAVIERTNFNAPAAVQHGPAARRAGTGDSNGCPHRIGPDDLTS